MKNCLFSLLLLLAFLGTSFDLQAKKIEGTIVKEGIPEVVTLFIPIRLGEGVDFHSLQEEVRYFDSENKKQVYQPTEIDEFRFTYRDEEIRMISWQNDIRLGADLEQRNMKQIFIRSIGEGPLSLFVFYDLVTALGIPKELLLNNRASEYLRPSYVFIKEGYEPHVQLRINFKKELSEYFEDCPSLAEKIQDATYHARDVKDILQYYNKNCSVQAKEIIPIETVKLDSLAIDSLPHLVKKRSKIMMVFGGATSAVGTGLLLTSENGIDTAPISVLGVGVVFLSVGISWFKKPEKQVEVMKSRLESGEDQ